MARPTFEGQVRNDGGRQCLARPFLFLAVKLAHSDWPRLSCGRGAKFGGANPAASKSHRVVTLKQPLWRKRPGANL
jgi:hypothetical protein